MRIAVFSDVHGNITGARAVLEHIRREGGADAIYCAGDLFGGGPGHRDLLRLLERHGVQSVAGNHEQGDLDLERYLHLIPERHRRWAVASRDWLHANLGNGGLAVLAALPLTRKVALPDGRTMCVCHASPQDPRAHVTAPDSDARELRRAFSSRREDVFVFGHFHEPHLTRFDGKLLANVAYVGMRYDGYAGYALFIAERDRFSIRRFLVPYDAEEEQRLMDERGVPRMVDPPPPTGLPVCVH
jgi:predicted phosphodiesterase